MPRSASSRRKSSRSANRRRDARGTGDADDIERPDLLSYASEKLGSAAEVLATHPANVKLRLKAAAQHLARVPPRGLPQRLRREFESIWHELTKRPSRESEVSPLAATIHRMRLATGAKLAQRIYSLSAEVNYIRRDR